MHKRFPFIALFTTTIIYGLTNIMIRFAGKENHFSTVFFVLLFSTIMFLPILKLGSGLGEVKSLRQLRLIVPLGFFVAATWFLIYFAIMNTSIANAVLGYMTTPIFVIILSPFLLKEQINKSITAALFLALLGVLLIFDPQNLIRAIAPVGIISGIFAGFASAMMEIIGRKLKNQYSPSSLTFLGTSIGMLFMFPMFLVTGLIIPDTTSVVVILLLGLGGVSGSTLLYYGLKHIPASSASIFLLLEPFVSIVAAFIIFIEVPSILTILGAALLVVADIIIIQNQR
jgi:drug/metabolite transporter (DMT)-like permease